jgi:hypothetical protein
MSKCRIDPQAEAILDSRAMIDFVDVYYLLLYTNYLITRLCNYEKIHSGLREDYFLKLFLHIKFCTNIWKKSVFEILFYVWLSIFLPEGAAKTAGSSRQTRRSFILYCCHGNINKYILLLWTTRLNNQNRRKELSGVNQ